MQYLKKILVFTIISFFFACSNEELDLSNESDLQTANNELDVTLENNHQNTIISNYIYKGQSIEITEIISGDNKRQVVENKALEGLRTIYENQPTLMQVYGLSEDGSVYLFDNEKEHNAFIIELNKKSPDNRLPTICTDQNQKCSGGNGGGGTGPGNSSQLYTTNNMRIYANDVLSNEIDWTSSCYEFTGTNNNNRRMANFDESTSIYWEFSNSNQNCYPNGIYNVNDKLSSIQVSPQITRLGLYQHKDFGGRSCIIYRRDVGFLGILLGKVFISGPNNAPANNGWMFVPHLSDFQIGPLGIFGNWDNYVSSIKLN